MSDTGNFEKKENLKIKITQESTPIINFVLAQKTQPEWSLPNPSNVY